MKHIILLIAACLLPLTASAEISKKFGDVEVHYNALLTDNLKPDVAKNYNIIRSHTRGMLTLSVLKKNKLGVQQPIKADVSAYFVNITNQLGDIDMRQIQEGNAIYYLGVFRVSTPETLTIYVTVKPKENGGDSGPYKFSFKQDFE